MNNRNKVRLLFVAFVILYAADHTLTAWGLHHGGTELNPTARAWYNVDDITPLSMKALGVGAVALLCILLPPRHTIPYLALIVVAFTAVDLWSVGQIWESTEQECYRMIQNTTGLCF